MAKKPWFKVVNKAESKTPTIYIYGIIGESWFSDRSVTCNQFVAALDDLAEKNKQIDVRINSPGGSVWDGMAIVNAISQCKAEVHTYIDGVAYSMGAIIALSGRKVFASSMSRYMLHTALTGAYGHSKDLRKTADELDAFNRTIAQLVADKTGMSLQEVMDKWFNYEDHYFSPDEMLSNKLIDEVIQVKTKGAQNFHKMSVADAFDYFSKQEDLAEQEEQEVESPNNLDNSIETDMKFEKFIAFTNKVRQGEIPTAEDITAAQAELTEAGIGVVLISPQENLIRNQQTQLLTDIKALLPENAQPVAAIQAIKKENADVRACFANASEEGFNLVASVTKAVADAKAYAEQDGDEHDRQEQQDDPKGKKDSKQVFTAHFNKVAKDLGLPMV